MTGQNSIAVEVKRHAPPHVPILASLFSIFSFGIFATAAITLIGTLAFLLPVVAVMSGLNQ